MRGRARFRRRIRVCGFEEHGIRCGIGRVVLIMRQYRKDQDKYQLDMTTSRTIEIEMEACG